ncbi:MAG: 7TM-DISM domain-containing protein [Polaromonas sp.]
MFSLRFIWFGLWRLAFVAFAITTVLAQASDAPVPVDLSRPELDASMQTFAVLQDVPASWSIAEVLAEPTSRFAVFDPKKTYAVSIDKAIWLHFRVAAGSIQPAEKIVFELPKPYVDEVRFYYKGQDGQWVMQLAGN